MPARAEVAQPGPEGVERDQQVGDQDDQAALPNRGGDLFEGFGQVGGLAGGLAFEDSHQPAEVAGPVARGEIVGDPVVEGDQADGVALAGEEVGDRGGGGPGIIPLGVRARAVAHRPAGVDDQVAAEVRLVLEPLDVVAVRAGEQLPVDVPGVVAGGVFAILAELDGEAVIGAPVDPLDEPLDRHPRPDLEALDAHQGPGVDGRGRGRGRNRGGGGGAIGSGHQRSGPFMCSSKRSITASTVTPSASAR